MAKTHQEPHGSWLSFLVVLGVCLLYVLACFLPCIEYPRYDEWDFEGGPNIGLAILLFGWSGGNNGVPWSANVFLAFGLACLWSNWLRAAFWSGLLASLLGLTTWWVRSPRTVVIGYYVWQASLLLLAGGAALAIYRQGRASHSAERKRDDRDHSPSPADTVSARTAQ